MSLFNVKDKLYKNEEKKNISEHEITQYNLKASEAGVNIPKNEDLWLEKKDGLDKEEKRKITNGLLSLIVILAIILVMVIAFEVRQMAFNSKNASIAIVGAASSNSGQVVTYEINYKNNNWVGMKNAVIKLSYPEEFRPEPSENFKEEDPTSGVYSIGEVAMRSSGKISFSGRAYSPKGALIYLKANLDYQPSIFFGQFETNTQLGMNVIPAPITLEIEGPQDMVSGNVLDYLINYRNDGAEAIDNLQVLIQYPEGFTFSTASPSALGNNDTWQIGTLQPGESGKIIVNGQLEGGGGMTRIARVSMGIVNQEKFISYNDETLDTRMIASPLLITQTVNENKQLSVSAGEHLQFNITYRNNGNIGLRDVIVSEKLESPVLDFATLEMSGGRFDAANNLIIWKAADIPAFKNLAPGASGKINFSIQVKKNISLDGENKKNFVVTSLTSIDSPDVPTSIAANKIVSSNKLSMKLNSKIILETKGFYHDDTLPNSGPIPPRVGQETTFTLHWKAINVSNDINGVTVTANLPTNATMTGKISPDDARIEYNERTNLVTWNIGKMDAGEGVLSAPQEVAFQVKIVPSINQADSEVSLLDKSTLNAHDLFTGEELKVDNDAKTTNLYEDSALMAAGGNRVSR